MLQSGSCNACKKSDDIGRNARLEEAFLIDQKVYSLIKVAEKGSYTRAANSLGLTQPAVSQHIRMLEDELQVRLFEHSHNQIHLTAEGEVAVDYAKRLVSLEENMYRAVKNEKQKITSLTVGISHTMECSKVVGALASFADRDAGMMIKIITESTVSLYRKLRNLELDFAVVAGRSADAGLQYIQMDTDSLVLAVAPDHPLAQKETITIDELKKEQLILRLPTSNTMRLFTANLVSQNLSLEDFNVILELDNIATIKDLIRRNFGVSILAKSACLDELKKHKLEVLSIENLSMNREINLVCRSDYEHPELPEKIVQIYKNI